MATLWIREFQAVGAAPRANDAGGIVPGSGTIPVAQEPGKDQTPVTFSTSAQSAAFGDDTLYIEMYGSAAFHYVVGPNPTATTNAMKVAADTSKVIGVAPGHKIAAIAAA